MRTSISMQPLKFEYCMLYTFFNIPLSVLKIGQNLKKNCDEIIPSPTNLDLTGTI